MDWFKRKKSVMAPVEKKDVPDGLWIKCNGCGEIIYKKELEKAKKLAKKYNIKR